MEWSLWKEEDFPRTPILKIDRRKVAETVSGVQLAKEVAKIETQDKLISLISQITKIPSSKIKEDSILAGDLKIDSLGRVELLSLIENEKDFAVAIPETAINPQTTIADVRHLIKESPAVAEEIPINEWNYLPWFAKIRTFLQDALAFPIHALFVPLDILGRENLKKH